ncbi:MAG: NAD(P)/FAD-dependent oxidoreductase [Hyphomicrobiaceae bacterium]
MGNLVNSDVAVIGAGMAGLVCARRLVDAGLGVTVFDKGRGLGGRLATRRARTFAFDHGAPLVTAEHLSFSTFLDELVSAASAAPWLSDATSRGPSDKALRCVVGLPGMSGLLAPLAKDLDIRRATEIGRVALSGPDRWMVTTREGMSLGPYRAIAITIPAEQAAKLVEPAAPALAAPLADVSYDPCLTMMAGFEVPLRLPDHLGQKTGCLLASILRNDLKPGRDETGVSFVVHANADWSRDNLNQEPDTIARDLLAAFEQAARDAGATLVPAPAYLQGHRWRFARTRRALGESHIFDPALRLGLAGDWCLGPNAEHAFLSGEALAGAMVAAISNPNA